MAICIVTSNLTLTMPDTVRGDSSEEFKAVNVEDTMPVYEEITTMKTEVIEEYYDYGTDDVKPHSMPEFRSVTDEYCAISPYEQTLKNECYKQDITLCKEENDVRLSGDVASKDDKKYVRDKYGYFTENKPKGERRFKCETCGRPFRRKPDLTKHVKTHDSKRQKEVRCLYCNKTYYTKRAVQCHIDAKHAHKKYKCELCDYTSGYRYDLKQHKLVKHGDGDKLYKCNFCEYTTHYKKSMVNHERTHSNALLKCTYKNCMCQQEHVSSKEKSCHCDPCQFETAYGSSLRDHIKVRHSVQTERHACTVCTYSTHFKTYLNKHMRTHASKESPNKYKCEYCDHTSQWKWNLEQHRLIHTNKEIFKCTYRNCKLDCVEENPCDCEACDYQTIHRSALKRHILTKHSGEAKKYVCAHCGFCTSIKESLKRHLLRKHANAKSVPCENS